MYNIQMYLRYDQKDHQKERTSEINCTSLNNTEGLEIMIGKELVKLSVLFYSIQVGLRNDLNRRDSP